MSDRRTDFERVVLVHLDAAYRLARWLAASRADGDDLVQDAVLKAFRAFHTLRDADARAWLLAIVRNCHRSGFRRLLRRREQPLPDDEGPGATTLVSKGALPEEVAAGAQRRRAMARVLRSMPEALREVLVLRELEDLSYREIAGILAVPIGTVMSRLARAREQFRDRWAVEHAGEPHDLH